MNSAAVKSRSCKIGRSSGCDDKRGELDTDKLVNKNALEDNRSTRDPAPLTAPNGTKQGLSKFESQQPDQCTWTNRTRPVELQRDNHTGALTGGTGPVVLVSLIWFGCTSLVVVAPAQLRLQWYYKPFKHNSGISVCNKTRPSVVQKGARKTLSFLPPERY